MKRISLISGLLVILLIAGCRIFIPRHYKLDESRAVRNVKYAGVRSSHYGIKPFPSPEEWAKAMFTMRDYYWGSIPCAIWIVGRFDRPRACLLEFPSDGNEYENIGFLDYDKHEPYLNHFDKAGIKVFLQVEPANADMITLIDLVLERYKHHECVAGFGVDVEWYKEADNPEWGVPVDDISALRWEESVKSHNPDYRIFLKHWDRNWMPPRYRGDIIFVDDSQMFENFDHLTKEFIEYWAAYFAPNMVFFQIGYPRDRAIWSKLRVPPEILGKLLAQNITQECGVFWVDFTLREVMPFLIP